MSASARTSPRTGIVPTSLLRDRVISRLSLPAPVPIANVDVAAGIRFSVTSQLPVMVPYRIPQACAAALATAGFADLFTRLR